MKQPLVSVIVPTKNSGEFLDACLQSIVAQTYKNIELLVVDNNSSDDTKAIAKKYTKHVYNHGPERSAQRNFGASKSKGEYLLFIDSDMELSSQVVEDCVQVAQSKDATAVVIPEESFGEGFWAQCKKLERSFYVGVEWMEAARFFTTAAYRSAGGYDEAMVSGEDWDLSQRMAANGPLARCKYTIYHNEGGLSLIKTLKKKYYYASKFSSYTSKHTEAVSGQKQLSVVNRYKLFLSKPTRLFKRPLVGTGMMIMKTLEFFFAGVAYARFSTLKNELFISSHHGEIEGALDNLHEFLIANSIDVTLLSHPLSATAVRSSTLAKNGKPTIEYSRKSHTLSALIVDFFLSSCHFMVARPRVAIGSNPFDVCVLAFAKWLSFSGTVIIYFASDYSENRFKSMIFNRLYRATERRALMGSKLVVSNTRRAEKARLHIGLAPKKSLVISNGIRFKKLKRAKALSEKRAFIYVGTVNPEHGLHSFIKAVGKRLCDSLVVIGYGDDLGSVVQLCADLHISCTVYKKMPHQWVMDYLEGFDGFGLAPYAVDSTIHSYYGSSLKILEYIAMGVPVITSTTTEISALIKEEALGVVYVDLNADQIKSRIDQFDLRGFKSKAEIFYEAHSLDSLYRPILSYINGAMR